MTDRDSSAIKRRLDAACAIVESLLDRAASHASLELRHEALEVIDETALPAAVFDVATKQATLLNASWRALFGMHGSHIVGVDEVARDAHPRHLPELEVELDSRPAFFAASLRPSRALDGTSRVIVTCIDITDMVIARRLAVPPGALVWGGPLARDANYFNHGWVEYAGPASGQATIHADDAAACRAAIEGGGEVNARLRHRDGDYRWHRITFTRSAPRWIGTALDIDSEYLREVERNELLTRERAARADAEQANRLKDQFLAAVAHELRTPLATMLLWEKVLRSGDTEPLLRAQALEAIRQSALSQARVVDDLLDISRAISGKLHVDMRPVEIESVLRSALDAIAPQAHANGVAIERGATLVGHVEGDGVRLRQVLDNLLVNAVKFTDSGGRVSVGVSRNGGSIVIAVADNGRGIAPEFLPHVFEPFSQTDDSLTHRDGGLGLGLAIAKQLVELHHGSLVASSAGEGRGSTFTVTLPLAAPSQRTPSPEPSQSRTLDGMRVLVVDDDRRVRDGLSILLDHAGAIVDTADSAESARASIAEQPPSVIVCDIGMPNEDGYSFIQRLRASGTDIVAIALTAHATEADALRALSAGFDRHLAKPIEFERLVANIHELVVTRVSSERA